MSHLSLRVCVRYLLLSGLALTLCACAVAFNKPESDATVSGDADNGVAASDAVGEQLQAPKTFNEYCGQFAKVWCQGHINCCDDPEDRHASVKECEEGFDRECRLYFLEPVYSGCVRYDKEAAQAYLSKLATMVPSCAAASIPWYGEIFNGTTPPEGACSYTLGDFYTPWLCCQSGTTCVAQTLDGERVTAQCKSGLKQLGQSCLGGDCAEGLYCSYDPANPERHCLKQKPLGEACSYSSECMSEFCKEGKCAAVDAKTLYCGRAIPCAVATAYRGSTWCERSWHCDGDQELRMRCDKEGSSWRCVCEHDTVQVKSFTSSSICDVSGKKFYAAVSTGCGWPQLKL